MDNLKKFLVRRMSHVEKRIERTKEIHGGNPNGNYNYYGGQTLGYWQGKLAAYELVLEEIEEMEGEK
jgi:hypothetical protein